MSADPVQLLDRLSPPDGWAEPTDVETDPVAAQILERVFADEGTNVVSIDAARRRRRRGIGGAIVVAALITGGAVAAIWNRSPEEARRAFCWSEAASPPEEVVVLAWNGRTDPVALCADEWSAGTFESSEPPGDLEGCVTDEDAAAVIPGGSGVCDALGFAQLEAVVNETTLAISDAQSELDRLFRPGICETRAIAEEETKRVLDAYGLSGWTITIAGTFSADETCATVFLVRELSTAVVNSRPPDF